MKPHDWHRRWQKFFKGLGSAGVSYLLYDTFSTARAAGSVNGTAAEPTGQTRTVTDGNNKLSITGGVLSFATGGVGSANPVLSYPQFTRARGLILLASLTNNGSAGNGYLFGWSTIQAAFTEFGIFPGQGINLAVRDNSVGIAVGGDIGTLTYSLAIILRSTGCWYFIKGGVFTNWTLLWISALNSANLFPDVEANNPTSVFLADNIRVPVTLYIPAPLAYDTFTRANGALGSTETTSPDGVAIAALVWNFTVGIWTISSNAAIATPSLGSDVIVNGGFGADTDWNKGAGWTIAAGLATAAAATTDLSAIVPPLTLGRWYQVTYTISGFVGGSVGAVIGSYVTPGFGFNGTINVTGKAAATAFIMRGLSAFTGSIDNVSAKLLTTAELITSVLVATADVIADVAITLGAGGLQAGLILNLDSTANPQNFIICYIDTSTLYLEECVAGVYTSKIATAITYGAGNVLRVERSGTECRVFYNNAAVGTVQTMSVNVNKNHGLFSTRSSNTLDNFILWARGTANEYGALDAF